MDNTIQKETSNPVFGKGFWVVHNPENDNEVLVIRDIDYSPDLPYHHYLSLVKLENSDISWPLNLKEGYQNSNDSGLSQETIS